MRRNRNFGGFHREGFALRAKEIPAFAGMEAGGWASFPHTYHSCVGRNLFVAKPQLWGISPRRVCASRKRDSCLRRNGSGGWASANPTPFRINKRRQESSRVSAKEIARRVDIIAAVHIRILLKAHHHPPPIHLARAGVSPFARLAKRADGEDLPHRRADCFRFHVKRPCHFSWRCSRGIVPARWRGWFGRRAPIGRRGRLQSRRSC